ncbi:amino acid adenylation domain-containing protein [Rossellomorea sp. BNER]|nr:amino acid adenylation domain-containing protein [Rossellomorea sp. BNER]
MFTSGEVLKTTHANTFHKLVKDVRLVNLYGPTEATIDVTFFNCPPEQLSSIPIGKPIDNTKMYIVDRHLHMVPVGVMGELCISGDGVARGYLNNESLTAEKFIDHPYEPGTKLYRTGDLAKWLPDGNIEYLGRMDSQIKIRGFRIELGEVEKSLLAIEGIEDGVVVVKENHDDKHLAAYYLGDAAFSAEELRKKLKAFLPEYMIPTYFVKLDHMPMSANGKIDRKALPEPDHDSLVSTRYEAPQNELQEKLATIWSDVLKKETIGIHDNFFEIGGHSLKATVVTNKVFQVLQMDVSLKAFFDHPTIKELSDHIEGQAEHRYEQIPVCGEQDVYETSSAQKRMYMVQQLEKGTVYNMPVLFAVEGDSEPERIEETFQKLVSRHESLRTYFADVNGEIVQKIHPDLPFTMERRDGSGRTVEALAKDFVRPFELDQVPLFRAELAESDEGTYVMVDMHHIISDGVSIERLLTEFNEIYNGKELEPLRIQYKDFAAWQNTFLKSDELKKQEAYWIQQFSDDIPVLNLPYDYKRPVMQRFEGDERRFTFSEEQTEALRTIANETGSTMHMVLLSAFYILLSKYSGQEDLVIGTPVAGRPHADLQNIIGMFVNTLALRNQAGGEKSYIEFLEEVKQNSLHAYDNQSYQFEELIDKLQVNRDTSRHPLFDVMFTMNHREEVGERESEGLQLNPVLQPSNQSKFDLTLHVTEGHRKLKGSFEYAASLFKGETIGRMIDHFTEIVACICRNKDVRLSEIEMMSEAEKHQILHDFNDTKADYPREKTIVQLFEEQAARTPDHIAVVFEDSHVTYSELNERSNAYARMLRDKGVKAGDCVGIMLERSMEMVEGIIGILKSGAAYLPIDPKNPNERIEFMLRDATINILLTSSEFYGRFDFAGEMVDVIDIEKYDEHIQNLELVIKPNDLAYIIYTSGTTGHPKGVMVEHQSLTQTMLWEKDEYKYNEKNVVLPLVNYAFDGFNILFYTPLISGSKVVLVNNEDMSNPSKISKYIRQYGITDYFSVPSIYLMVAEYLIQYERLDLGFVTLVGEEMPEKAIEYTKRLSAEIEIVNGYGPSESTVWTTVKRRVEHDCRDLIGKPIANTSVILLDKGQNIVPIGIPGEIYIGGSRLARGYLNNPELTVEKFIENPFKPGERLYKTGDVGKWSIDGNIQFLGREDNQVKIRGIRIELKEIEAALLRYPNIKETVVMVNESKEHGKYLCAYVTVTSALEKVKLKEYLKESLPEYMVPSFIKVIENIPLSRNGKVDRKSLPELTTNDLIYGKYEAPRNQTETKLAELWNDVLGTNRVGIEDNFFELGGDSLKLIKLLSRTKDIFGIEIELNRLYKSPTIEFMAKYILNEEYSSKYGVDMLQLLNKKQDKNIFAFPAVGGFGIVYSDLAKSIQTHSFYAFDFIEGEERVKQYVELILSTQPEGPYQLLGYSAGGNLAFEVAVELERWGKEVSDLILLDSYKINNKQTEIQSAYLDNLYQNIVEEAKNDPMFKEYLEIEYFREKVIARVKAYTQFLNSLAHEHIIHANIHFIRAEENKEEKDNDQFILLDWEDFTNRTVEYFNGFGEHGDMLTHDYLPGNTVLISDILKNTEQYSLPYKA